MPVIGFFQNLLNNFGEIFRFCFTPMKELTNGVIAIDPFASMSIADVLSTGLVTALVVLIAIHFIRLFIGG